MRNAIKLSGSKLQSEIDPNEYVFMHKAELKVAISDNNRFRWGSRICDFLGPLFIGIGLTIIFSEKIIYEIFTNGFMWIIFGLSLTLLGFYFQKQQEDIINDIFKEKLDEIG